MSEAKISEAWPDYLMIRDTQLHDDAGGLGQRIFTTAGAGYEKVKYIRADLAYLYPQPAELAEQQGNFAERIRELEELNAILQKALDRQFASAEQTAALALQQDDRIEELEEALAATGKQQGGEVEWVRDIHDVEQGLIQRPAAPHAANNEPSPTVRMQVGEVQGDARAQFEAWAKSAGLETKIYPHNDMHSHPVTRGAWMAWQHLAACPRLRQEPVSIKSVRQFIADRTPNEEYREDILSGDHDHSAWFDHIRELMTALSQGNNS